MPAPILLIHGAWHGGWCWERVVPLLEAAGHVVHAPTLRGLDADFAGDPPGIEDHVAEVIGLLDSEDLQGAVLVGHSWGGMVVSGVADKVAHRLRALVYLDAAVPRNGDDFAAQAPGQDAEALARRRMAFKSMAADGAWLSPPPPQMVGVSDPADAAWLTPRLRPHPLRTWLEPVAIRAEVFDPIPKTYVLATNPPSPMMGYPAHAEHASATAGWTRRDIDCGHDMMVVAPARTAELILEAARG